MSNGDQTESTQQTTRRVGQGVINRWRNLPQRTRRWIRWGVPGVIMALYFIGCPSGMMKYTRNTLNRTNSRAREYLLTDRSSHYPRGIFGNRLAVESIDATRYNGLSDNDVVLNVFDDREVRGIFTGRPRDGVRQTDEPEYRIAIHYPTPDDAEIGRRKIEDIFERNSELCNLLGRISDGYLRNIVSCEQHVPDIYIREPVNYESLIPDAYDKWIGNEKLWVIRSNIVNITERGTG